MTKQVKRERVTFKGDPENEPEIRHQREMAYQEAERKRREAEAQATAPKEKE